MQQHIIVKYSIIFFHVLLGAGPVTFREGSDRSAFVSDIDSLEAYGPLNPDCPELAFTGMLNAIREGPTIGSPMFVFTDASAKDADSLNIADLKGMTEAMQVTITFFTGVDHCGPSPVVKDYDEIARDTGGKRVSFLELFVNRVTS